MNEHREDRTLDRPDADESEGFLGRWSRRKAEARRADLTTQDPPPAPEQTEAAHAEAADEEIVLPPLESLTEDSDYSAFLSRRVGADVRRAALRKLFASAKFNVCDGLDVYCRDYTQFEPLGDIVTADMRFHMERAAKLAAALAEREAAAAEAAAASSASAGSEAELDGGETDPPGRNTDDDPVEPA